MALVFETIGTIQSFFGAVKRIQGLEWLAEVEEDVIESDADFYNEKSPDQSLAGSLYLVMSDQRALTEMLSLWQRYQQDPEQRFEHGFNAWRCLFKHLKEVRPWSTQDRLRETGLLEDWAERLSLDHETVRTEIELWYRGRGANRQREAGRVRAAVESAGGRFLSQCVIDEIAYHAVLAELPASAAEAILRQEEVALVQCEGVMFFRPVGQMAAVPADDEPSTEPAPQCAPLETGRQPYVALLDGLPMEGHDLLRGRLNIDDPDGWAAEIPAGHRNHGTAMASLILHGDLGNGEPPLETPAYVRPILKPKAFPGISRPQEQIPEDVLAVDLVHRAVRRILEGEGNAPGAAPSVLVLSFSVGDPSRPFDRFVSPMARLLDWLAWKHKILIVVSAGNHAGGSLSLTCQRDELNSLDAEELQRQAWQSLASDKHLRRLLSPAEAVNVLTVGGEHSDSSGDYIPGFRIDVFGADSGARLPSPITAFGPGVSRSVKPEVFFPAGRQLFQEELGTGNDQAALRVSTVTGRPPGQRAASAGMPGVTDATRFLCGTSNAAALASRTAARLCERFPSLLDGYAGTGLPDRRFAAPLLKAFLVHGARWGGAKEELEKTLTWPSGPRKETRPTLGLYLGFGFAQQDWGFGCTEQRVTLVSWGELTKDEGHRHEMPLPPSLSGKKLWKRVVVTVAWLTPIDCFDRRYRRGQIWFSPRQKGEFDLETTLGVRRTNVDYHAAGRGTVQHEVFEGDEASAFLEDDHLVLKVSCREHAGQLTKKIPYGLLLTLEVAPGVGINVYQEVRTRIRPPVRVDASRP